MNHQEMVDKARGFVDATFEATIGGLYLILAYAAAKAGHSGYEALQGYFGGEGFAEVGGNALKFVGGVGATAINAALLRSVDFAHAFVIEGFFGPVDTTPPDQE